MFFENLSHLVACLCLLLIRASWSPLHITVIGMAQHTALRSSVPGATTARKALGLSQKPTVRPTNISSKKGDTVDRGGVAAGSLPGYLSILRILLHEVCVGQDTVA